VDWFVVWYMEAGGSWVWVVWVQCRVSGNGEPERWVYGAREQLQANLLWSVGIGVGSA
jgi:hypothetical protein